MENISTAKVSIYVDGNGGTVYEYTIPPDPAKAREHGDQIVRNGYRHNSGTGQIVFIPAHRIFKVVVSGLDCPTNYPDCVRGT